MEADDLFMRDFVIVTRLVEEVYAGRIGRIAVCDESRILVKRSCTDGFIHSDGSW